MLELLLLFLTLQVSVEYLCSCVSLHNQLALRYLACMLVNWVA